MKNHCNFLIIANGEDPEPTLVQKLSLSDFLVIACDGGVANSRKIGLEPDIVIGDLDSVDEGALLRRSSSEIINDPDQETTDLEKALAYIERFEPVKIVVMGGSGKRSDHFLGNIIVLHDHRFSPIIDFYDRFGRIFFLNQGVNELSFSPGTLVSLFSLLPVRNLSLTGFRYSLSEPGIRNIFHGISNVTDLETCVVSFEGGKIIVYEKIL